MKKTSITISFEDEKLDALEFSLKKENTSVQAKMDEALRQLYERTVPEPVREYLNSRAAPSNASRPRPKRPPKPVPKPTVEMEVTQGAAVKSLSGSTSAGITL